jgi:hypothetical protein
MENPTRAQGKIVVGGRSSLRGSRSIRPMDRRRNAVITVIAGPLAYPPRRRAVAALRRGREACLGDERILGSGNFVEQMLRAEDPRAKRHHTRTHRMQAAQALVRQRCAREHLSAEELRMRGRCRRLSTVRAARRPPWHAPRALLGRCGAAARGLDLGDRKSGRQGGSDMSPIRQQRITTMVI